MRHRVVHVHAKDISIQHAEDERGKVTGTPVGCAAAMGSSIGSASSAILHEAGYDGALSVECGTPEQAARSLAHLNQVLAEVPAELAAKS